jgi:hypothetical protein
MRACMHLQRMSVAAYDIGFSVVFKPSGGDGSAGAAAIVVLQSARVAGQLGGVFDAPGKGVLVLEFDNEYSVLRTKQVHYSVDVALEGAAAAAGGAQTVLAYLRAALAGEDDVDPSAVADDMAAHDVTSVSRLLKLDDVSLVRAPRAAAHT